MPLVRDAITREVLRGGNFTRRYRFPESPLLSNLAERYHAENAILDRLSDLCAAQHPGQSKYDFYIDTAMRGLAEEGYNLSEAWWKREETRKRDTDA